MRTCQGNERVPHSAKWVDKKVGEITLKECEIKQEIEVDPGFRGDNVNFYLSFYIM